MKIETLFTQEEIAKRNAELGADIANFYQGKDLTVIAIMNGATYFAADLTREINLPLFFDTIAATSYVNDASCGKLSIRCKLKLNPENRHILIVDDVLDTGVSLATVIEELNMQNPASVKTCVLLEKEREHAVSPEWVGFRVPDVYVVGYGLDSYENYRNLPFIGHIIT